MLTAWDGHVRIDYLPDVRRLRIVVLTIERTMLHRLHDGLACAFVINDPDGPPTFVELELLDGITDDVRALLGAPISALAEAVLSGAQPGRGPVSRSGRLNLADVETLARTWAPYRDQVLRTSTEAAPSLGTWAGELWALFRDAALAAALGAGSTEQHGVRGIGEPAESDWQYFDLPAGLADAAGVERGVTWTPYDEYGERGLVVRAQLVPSATGPARLLVGLDAPGAEWVPLLADPERDGGLIADVPLRGNADDAALRFRTDSEDT